MMMMMVCVCVLNEYCMKVLARFWQNRTASGRDGAIGRPFQATQRSLRARPHYTEYDRPRPLERVYRATTHHRPPRTGPSAGLAHRAQSEPGAHPGSLMFVREKFHTT